MEINAQNLVDYITNAFIIFARIAAFITIMPILGTQTVPVAIRLGIPVFITMVVFPFVTIPDHFSIFSFAGLIVLMQQILIGMALGFTIRILFSALETGGYAIGQTMGLGFAQMVDPANGVTVPVTSQFYTLLATLIFLSMNGHLIALNVVVDSFTAMPVGLLSLSDINVWSIISLAKWIFIGAVMIALPVVGALLIVNIAFGVMMRAAPQLNIFSIGFPVSLILGFVFILIALPMFYPQFSQLLEVSINGMHAFMVK